MSSLIAKRVARFGLPGLIHHEAASQNPNRGAAIGVAHAIVILLDALPARRNALDAAKVKVKELFSHVRVRVGPYGALKTGPAINVRDWFRRVLQARTHSGQQDSAEQRVELTRQLTMLQNQQDRLLNLRLVQEIDEGTFATKNTELRDRIAQAKRQLETRDRRREENGEIALKAFGLSQPLREKWLTGDYRAKRRSLDIVCLDFRLEGVSLVPTIRKPFDGLAEGPISADNRDDWI